MARIITMIALALVSSAALAAPITSSVSCAADTCIITPDGGPAALDNTNFALELDWSPQHIELAEPADDRGEWRLVFFYELTGTVTAADSFETVPVIGNELLDKNGNPTLTLQYDDVNYDAVTQVLRINFEIFGPDTLSTFLAHGLELAPSSFIALNGTTIDSFAFRDARLSTLMGSATDGIWPVKVAEPSLALLLALGAISVGVARRRRVS